jgi:hypothetical protein
MASWKKVIVSGSNAELAQITASVGANLATLELGTALAVSEGGTGATSLTDGGILLGSGANSITATSVLTDGQLLIGDGSGDPTLAELSTTTGNNNTGSLKITNGAGTITLSVDEQSIGIGNLSASNAAAAGNVLKVSADGQHITYGSEASGDVSSVTTPSNSGLSIDDTSGTDGNVSITMSIDSLSQITSLAAADTFAFHDADATSVVKTKKIPFTNLTGSIISSINAGDVTVNQNGTATIQADAVEDSMLNDNVISGQTELAQGSLAAADEILISDGGTLKKFGVDSLAKDALALTSEEAVVVASDFFVYLDGSGTGETKKDSISDLVVLQAGKGLSGDSGVFNVEATANSGLQFTGVGAAGTLGLNLDTTTGNDTLQMDSNGLSLKTTIEGNRTFSDDITINGDLNVAGTASFNHSTNLSVADKYILLNSGSSGTSDSGGIVIGGPDNATNGKGALFGYHSGSAASDTTRRWGVVADFDADSSSDFVAEAFMSTVMLSSVEGNVDPDSANDKYKKAGNIFIDETEGIPYIYV